MKSNLIFLDTETTGKDGNARLIQLAYKKRGDAHIVTEFFKPPVPIEIEAMAVHHITEKKVAGKPAFAESSAHPTLGALLKDAILVAHNAKFDIGILEREGVRTGTYICTMKVAQAMHDLPMYKMQYLRYLWDVDGENGAHGAGKPADEKNTTAHDAEGDVAILEKVFDRLVTDYIKEHGTTEAETIDAFVEISKKPTLLKRATFGKYAGKTFEEIKASDPGYLEWMGSLQDKDEDFTYTVKHYLK